jgi:hypothetical protein
MSEQIETVTSLVFEVKIESCNEGGFSAYSEAVPGANGQGETMEDALVNFAEGVRDFVRYRQEKAAKGFRD